jgi:hypothetical protein
MKPIMPLAAHSSCGDFGFFFFGCSKKKCRDTEEIPSTKAPLKRKQRERRGKGGHNIGMSPHQTTWNKNSLCLLIMCVPSDPHFSKITQFCMKNGSYKKDVPWVLTFSNYPILYHQWVILKR